MFDPQKKFVLQQRSIIFDIMGLNSYQYKLLINMFYVKRPDLLTRPKFKKIRSFVIMMSHVFYLIKVACTVPRNKISNNNTLNDVSINYQDLHHLYTLLSNLPTLTRKTPLRGQGVPWGQIMELKYLVDRRGH